MNAFCIAALFHCPAVSVQNSAFPKQGGFLPNVFKVLSHRPAEFRAFFSYYDALMSKETGEYLLVTSDHITMCSC